MITRPAVAADAESIAVLSDQLGYPADAIEIRNRLDRLRHRLDEHAVIVAERESAVVGWVHIGLTEAIESPPFAEIFGLVVDRQARRAGVGRCLVDAAERWATERGLDLVNVRSRTTRTESHLFYERLGYVRVKSQHVYRKVRPGSDTRVK